MAVLSERERRFVEAFMGKAAGNATQAAKLAGYSKKTAASIGSRLLRKVKIQRALQQRVDADPAAATREQRQQFWTAVMNGTTPFKKASLKDRLKASELLGKSQADFIDKHEHGGPGGAPIAVRVVFGGRYRPDGTLTGRG